MFCAPQSLCKAYAAENLSNGSFDNGFVFVWVICVSLHLNCCKDDHRYLLALLQHADMNTEPAAVKNFLTLWDDNINKKLFRSETIVKVECNACKVVLESPDHRLNLFKWLGISRCAKTAYNSKLFVHFSGLISSSPFLNKLESIMRLEILIKH
ncbi:hypothetical protein EmuJ_000730800 [Echinococcus multilocularis]|uniref:Uncharacterized protein n=1 Tax=Echinococcus multilocularis TaxID=6211 RepID=A0A068Y4P0_ECHMU|nr:hypothetical protein EmuJ_000730800 [Echinococcus multilocularis]